MPYRGRGDYRGRGGIFSSIAHVVGGAIGGFIRGGPVGGIIGAGKGVASSVSADIAAQGGLATAPIGGSTAATPARDIVHVAHEQAAILKAKQSGKITAPTADALAKASVGKATVLSSGLVLHHGNGSHRRINWANHRALGRAERRIASAVKHMTKYIKWVHPKKDGHAAPKFRRKK